MKIFIIENKLWVYCLGRYLSINFVKLSNQQGFLNISLIPLLYFIHDISNGLSSKDNNVLPIPPCSKVFSHLLTHISNDV